MVKGQAWWGRSILPAIFLAWPRSLMSPKSHGVLIEKTSFAIHAFMFLWPDIFSWCPFQIVLGTFYQYEAIVTRCTRLVIRVIKRANHYAYIWWSLLYNFFLAYSSSCSIDQKHPAAPPNGRNHHPSRLSTGVLISLFLSPEIQVSTGKDLLIPRGRAGLEASYLSPISPPFLLLVR